MVCVASAYAQSTSARASFLHLALRRRCQNHPIAMFNSLVLVAFVWTLVPTGSALEPPSVSMEYTGSVQIPGTTAKTSRLPKRGAVGTCPEQDRGSDWLECLTAIAYEDGKADALFG